MVAITVETEIDAPPDVVWSDLRNIATHSQWMHDAESIWFTSRSREGVGTTFDCETKVGPIRLTDAMEITTWVEAETMGVRHTGVVTGEGAFTMSALPGGGTLFKWAEELSFPWWLGGPVGEPIGSIVLKLIWKRNLQNLTKRFRNGEVVRTAG
ncbi:MAG: carbon monoxide dehydrogenase subunit G [Verrucomicrobiales bacterium]|jgi:carbon monoxide dehydrogenase subunit G